MGLNNQTGFLSMTAISTIDTVGVLHEVINILDIGTHSLMNLPHFFFRDCLHRLFLHLVEIFEVGSSLAEGKVAKKRCTKIFQYFGRSKMNLYIYLLWLRTLSNIP